MLGVRVVGASVVGTDRLPAIAVALDFLGQDPCADVDVDARIVKGLFGDAGLLKKRKPARADLHQSDVIRGIRVAAYRVGVARALDVNDRKE